VVFTLPPPAAEIAFQNKRAVYAILFRAAAQALHDIAADPMHLGAEIGAVALLRRRSCLMAYDKSARETSSIAPSYKIPSSAKLK